MCRTAEIDCFKPADKSAVLVAICAAAGMCDSRPNHWLNSSRLATVYRPSRLTGIPDLAQRCAVETGWARKAAISFQPCSTAVSSLCRVLRGFSRFMPLRTLLGQSLQATSIRLKRNESRTDGIRFCLWKIRVQCQKGSSFEGAMTPTVLRKNPCSGKPPAVQRCYANTFFRAFKSDCGLRSGTVASISAGLCPSTILPRTTRIT